MDSIFGCALNGRNDGVVGRQSPGRAEDVSCRLRPDADSSHGCSQDIVHENTEFHRSSKAEWLVSPFILSSKNIVHNDRVISRTIAPWQLPLNLKTFPSNIIIVLL